MKQLELFPTLTPRRIFSRVHSATHTGQRIRIRYGDVRCEVTERTLQPLEMYRVDGTWYLLAFCELRQARRHFRLDRIQRAALLGCHVPARAPLVPVVVMAEEAEALEACGLTAACSYACRNGCDHEMRWVA